ncbi:hypothetical protein EV2_044958 [Malus domestica]
MVEGHDSKMHQMADGLKEQGENDDHKFEGQELKEMGFSIRDRITLPCLRIWQKCVCSRTLDESEDRFEYVRTLHGDRS